MDSTSLTSEQEADSGVESTNSSDSMSYIRVSVPDLNIQGVKDGFNYGLYCPPMNGRAGKFLDEERLLKDYPLPGPIGYLEFKLKRRVYKHIQMNARRAKQIHTKGNLKQFIDCVRRGDHEKITKFVNKGLDPNFNDPDLGETPLTLSVSLPHPTETILALVGGGAHLDFRSKKGFTPLHVAAQLGNEDAIRSLLDLGASANYKDLHGLTPLYHCLCNNTSARCAEMLLYDHALVGIVDDYGWTEMHQACKAGRVQHLEQLIYYGADMNRQNCSGNTPLHVCAINNQEECARALLFRGADKTILNYANQDAFETAVISGNTHLAIIIKDFMAKDIVPYQELPKYNEKRRSHMMSTISLQRSRSNPHLQLLFDDDTMSRQSGKGFAACDMDLLHHNSVGSLSRSGGRNDRDRRMTALPGFSEFAATMNDGMHFRNDSPRSSSLSSAESYPVNSEANARKIDPSSAPPLLSSSSPPLSTSSPLEQKYLPRIVTLHSGASGYGFILRGAKAPNKDPALKLEFVPTPELPGLQYFENVERGSMADQAGIKSGDFLLEVNGVNVAKASHDYTVSLIKGVADVLTMTVVTPVPASLSMSVASVDCRRAPSLNVQLPHVMKRTDRALSEPGSDNSMDQAVAVQHSPDSKNSGSLLVLFKNIPDDKIASIRSVHGKRLAPAIPEDDLNVNVPVSGSEERKLWKAQSVHSLPDGGLYFKFHSSEQSSEYASIVRSQNDESESHPRRSDIDAKLSSIYDRRLSNISSGRNDDLSVIPKPPDYPPPLPPVRKVSIKPQFENANQSQAPSTVMQSFTKEADSSVQNQNSSLNYSVSAPGFRAIEGRGVYLKKDETGKDKIPQPPPLPPKLPTLAAWKAQSKENGNKPIDSHVDGSRKQTSSDSVETVDAGNGLKSGCKSDIACSGSPNFLVLAENARLAFLKQQKERLDKVATSGPESQMAERSTAQNSFESASTMQDVSRRISLARDPSHDSSQHTRDLRINGVTEDDSSTDTSPVSSPKQISVMNRKMIFEGKASEINDNKFSRTFSQEPDKMPIQYRIADEIKDFAKKDLHRTVINVNTSPVSHNKSSMPELHPPTPFRQSASPISVDIKRLVVPPPPTAFSSADDSFSDSFPSCEFIDTLNFVPPPPPPGFDDNSNYPSPASNVKLSPTNNNSVAVLKELPSRLLKNGQKIFQSSHQMDEILSRPVSSWSVIDVAVWLEGLHMGEHSDSFVRNNIDGSKLSLLGRTELIALGVSQVGQRMNIERAIKKAVMSLK